MARELLETGEIYHVYNRGVEKRTVFESDTDRIRFVHDLYEFNDSNPVKNLTRVLGTMSEVPLHSLEQKPRELLVNILAWCIMPNHFHLLLQQKVDGGITKFMRKLGTGYTNAFNETRKRVGPLFQGTFKSKLVSKESHLLHLPHYLHLNPLDLLSKNEKLSNSALDINRAVLLLDSYRWSSYQDFCGTKNFPSIIDSSFALKTFGSPESYRNDIISWIREGSADIFGSTLLD